MKKILLALIILYINLFSNTLNLNNDVIVENKIKTASFVKNKNYACVSTGHFINDKFISNSEKSFDERTANPIRFYVDNKNIFHTDELITASFKIKKDNIVSYLNNKFLYLLKVISPDKRYLILQTMMEEQQLSFVHLCVESELDTESCDKGNMNDCFQLGTMYYKGYSTKQNHKKARELYTQACNGFHSKSCHNLGYMYQKGQGGRKDIKKAIKLYKKSCDAGNKQSCRNYKILKK